MKAVSKYKGMKNLEKQETINVLFLLGKSYLDCLL